MAGPMMIVKVDMFRGITEHGRKRLFPLWWHVELGWGAYGWNGWDG